VLRVSELECGYGRADPVLRNVSFELAPGEILGVLGRNGVGKSTLVKVLTGLLPVRSGSILIDDAPVNSLPPRKRLRRGLAAVPEGRQIFAGLTVGENLAVAALAASRPMTSEALSEATGSFPEILKRKNELAGGLSGGQQQMLAIARGLITRPRYLLVDEPSLGLAPRVINDVGAVLQSAAARDVGVLLVEQNVGLVEQLCERALVLSSNHYAEIVDLTKTDVATVVRRAYLESEGIPRPEAPPPRQTGSAPSPSP
jgi:branched-chain amino acid transport system ATP-binding protein